MVCKSVLFGAILLAVCSLSSAVITDCGSVGGVLKTVVVSNCKPTEKRCILKKGTNVTMEINFLTNVNSPSLNAVVHGEVFGVLVPFNLPNSDGCKDSGISCPIQAGSEYKYITSMPILSEYPTRTTVNIKWELNDENKKNIICAWIPAKIM